MLGRVGVSQARVGIHLPPVGELARFIGPPELMPGIQLTVPDLAPQAGHDTRPTKSSAIGGHGLRVLVPVNQPSVAVDSYFDETARRAA